MNVFGVLCVQIIDIGPVSNWQIKLIDLNFQFVILSCILGIVKQYLAIFEDGSHLWCATLHEGIKKLLLGLNPGKAFGPDDIPIRILREAAHQIAPILKDIFTQSNETGTLPQDWLSANTMEGQQKSNS